MKATDLIQLRESFNLTSFQAASTIGDTSVSNWIAYESGLVTIPPRVECCLSIMRNRRETLVDMLFDELIDKKIMKLPSFKTLESYSVYFKTHSELDFIIYKSIIRNLKRHESEYVD